MGVLDNFKDAVESEVARIQQRDKEIRDKKEALEKANQGKLTAWKEELEEALQPLQEYFAVLSHGRQPRNSTIEISSGTRSLVRIYLEVGYEYEQNVNYDMGTTKKVWLDDAVIRVVFEPYENHRSIKETKFYHEPAKALENIGVYLKNYMVYVNTGERTTDVWS
jgi:hypothetical protein